MIASIPNNKEINHIKNGDAFLSIKKVHINIIPIGTKMSGFRNIPNNVKNTMIMIIQ